MHPFSVPTCRAIAWLFFGFKKITAPFYVDSLTMGSAVIFSKPQNSKRSKLILNLFIPYFVMNVFPVQKNILNQKGFSAGRRWMCSCRVAGVGARSPVPAPGGIRRGSRLSGLGVCSGPGARAPGVSVHINKLITYCYLLYSSQK